MALVSIVFLVPHILFQNTGANKLSFLLIFYVHTNAEMENTSRSQRWSRKASQPVNANRKGLDKLVLIFSLQVMYIPLFPCRCVLALLTPTYYLSNQSKIKSINTSITRSNTSQNLLSFSISFKGKVNQCLLGACIWSFEAASGQCFVVIC